MKTYVYSLGHYHSKIYQTYIFFENFHAIENLDYIGKLQHCRKFCFHQFFHLKNYSDFRMQRLHKK